MAIEIKMPALSPTMEEGTLAKWLVKEGDTVKSGDIMAEIETDKATMEFEAVDEGTIGKILVAEGTDGVKVGTVIATLIAARARKRSRRSRGSRAGAQSCGAPSRSSADATPTPHQVETGARQMSKRAKHDAEVADPAIPAGTEMVKTTVREALRDAMAEEMRRDDARLRDGRGSRAISGRLQGHPGPARRVRRQARDRHADHRIWLCRRRHGRGDGRPAARSSSS